MLPSLADSQFAGVDFRAFWQMFLTIGEPKPVATRRDLQSILARLLKRDPNTMDTLKAAVSKYLSSSENLTSGQIFNCLVEWEMEELQELCWTHLEEVLRRMIQ